MRPFVILLMLISLVSASKAASLCNASEKIYFSCIANGKIISLCGSTDLRKNTGYLQYRFGENINKIELEYPQKRENPSKHFTYGNTPYSRGWRTSVNFSIGRYRYSINNAVLTDGPPSYKEHKLSGVTVFKDADQISDAQCNNYTPFALEPSRLGIPYRDAE